MNEAQKNADNFVQRLNAQNTARKPSLKVVDEVTSDKAPKRETEKQRSEDTLVSDTGRAAGPQMPNNSTNYPKS
jgi:hypothetical protein